MSERAWTFYLDDMITFAEKVLGYSKELDVQAFVDSGLNYETTVRHLELLGEVTAHIPNQGRLFSVAPSWRCSLPAGVFICNR